MHTLDALCYRRGVDERRTLVSDLIGVIAVAVLTVALTWGGIPVAAAALVASLVSVAGVYGLLRRWPDAERLAAMEREATLNAEVEALKAENAGQAAKLSEQERQLTGSGSLRRAIDDESKLARARRSGPLTGSSGRNDPLF